MINNLYTRLCRNLQKHISSHKQMQDSEEAAQRTFSGIFGSGPDFRKSAARPDVAMMGADAPIRPRVRSAATPEGTPPRRVNKFLERIVPPQIPFNRKEVSSQPGMPVRRGRSSQEHALPENPGSNREAGEKNTKSENPGDASLAGTLPVTGGKTP